MLVDGQVKGSATTAADGIYTITTDPLSDGPHVITAINGASPASAGLNVTIDITPPSLQSASFNFDVPAQNLQFNFSEDITASIQVGDLALFNDTTMTPIATGAMSVQLDGANQRATWSFPGYANGYLPDGNYTATIAADNEPRSASQHASIEDDLRTERIGIAREQSLGGAINSDASS